jgi:hypothetical protein
MSKAAKHPKLTTRRAYLFGVLTGCLLSLGVHLVSSSLHDLYFRLDRLEYYVQLLVQGHQ